MKLDERALRRATQDLARAIAFKPPIKAKDQTGGEVTVISDFHASHCIEGYFLALPIDNPDYDKSLRVD